MIQYLYTVIVKNNLGKEEIYKTKNSKDLILFLNIFCITNEHNYTYKLSRIHNLFMVNKKTNKPRYKLPKYILKLDKELFTEYYKDQYIKKYSEDDYNKRSTVSGGSETRYERMCKHFYNIDPYVITDEL